ncbi:MAG: asparagine synthase (glutamine-hydrolyzing) [Thermodesulfobacteriota bacterium]
MCGIAGICGPGASREVLENQLTDMTAPLSHRGPDGEGLWIDSDARCAIGHKRLAIIDPAGGQQPMCNEDESIWITFNGCIYNYQDLARVLRQHGHVFRTNSDTEVIVHAYEQWGAECVKRFNGMWGFAIWDAREGALFCSRDRLGVKPFYYRYDGKDFVFASEIKAILAASLARPELNQNGLRQYLTFQYCLGHETLFNGISKLEPGHNLIVKPGEAPRETCYWDISFYVDTEHDEEYFGDMLRWLLEDAVRLRLRSDVPLGTHLSGGLDSSVVVSLARLLLGNSPIKTFTGAFQEGSAFDETFYARAVSDAADTEYLEIYLTPQDFASSIEKIIWHMDEPAAGPGVFPQHWVSKLASEHVKVVLGGQGGDEIFIGYARYLLAYLEECLRGAIENTAHRGHYVATLETIVQSLPTLENYIPMLKHFWQDGFFDAPARRYFRLMDRFSDSRAFISKDLKFDSEKTFEEFHSIFDAPGAAAMINRIQAFDLKTHLQALLHVEDRTSMAWGLESRVPLLDYRLVELIASIPPVIKFKNGELKYLFRRAVKMLVPDVVLNRTDKMGFPVPLSQWVARDLRDFVTDILTSAQCRKRGILDSDAIQASLTRQAPFSRGIWGALCLELWFRQFIDR